MKAKSSLAVSIGPCGDGRELFGDAAIQPGDLGDRPPNGYEALSVFDEAASGGNGDGRIDSGDAVFHQLVLWIDGDHDGRSSPAELYSLEDLGVEWIGLEYRESRRIDGHGNELRYWGRYGLEASRAPRFTTDVILRGRP